MERRAPRHDENGGDAIDMLDRLRGERHHQLRRLRNKRIGGEVDRGADRAVIVRLIAGLLVGKPGRSRRTGNRDGSTRDAVEMDVSERHDDLQRQDEMRSRGQLGGSLIHSPNVYDFPVALQAPFLRVPFAQDTRTIFVSN